VLDLSTLNPPQREAVTTPSGPLLVLAGAGSGKTRVITHRVAWLILQGAAPSSILAVTFTNKAADEMRERVTRLVGEAGEGVFVSTFHSFGRWLLEREHAAAGLPRRFAICDSSDQLAMVKRCMREVKVDDRSFDVRRVLALLSRAKNELRKTIPVRPEGLTSEQAAPQDAGPQRAGRRAVSERGACAAQPLTSSRIDDDYDLVASEVFPRYQAALRAQRAVDFDDLIALPVELLRGHAAVRERCQQRFRHLLVDEYQDTNTCQLELVKLLAGDRRDVCAVGDDDQAIYGWRGAEVKNILRFERHFPGAREIRLEQNYRSTGHILACANGVIGENPRRKPKRLWTAAGDGDPVQVTALAGEEEEARHVADQIVRGRAEGRPWSHFAVLYRLNGQARAVEEALREASVPYHVRAGPSFFDRAEVRDLLAYLKICSQPEDDVSLSRIVNVPARGVGDASMERVQARAVERGTSLFGALERCLEIEGLPRGAAEGMRELVDLAKRYRVAFRGGPIGEVARRLVAEVDLHAHARSTVKSAEAAQRKAGALEDVLRSIEGWAQRTTKQPTLPNYLAKLALDSREDESRDGEGVTLMTLHAAKGLEFYVVFLVGAEEDLLPCSGIQGEPRDLEEERRLAYVGITRARERLVVTRAAARVKRGKVLVRTPSRFLQAFPEGSYVIHDPTTVRQPPEEVALRSAEVMAALRARFAASKP
jgi:DNA helicase-2/ATP-dependent DNA helicase PcrA